MKPPNLPKKASLLTTTEAAEYVKNEYGFNVTRQTVTNWIKRGRYGEHLPAAETMHGYQIKKGELDDYIKTDVL